MFLRRQLEGVSNALTTAVAVDLQPCLRKGAQAQQKRIFAQRGGGFMQHYWNIGADAARGNPARKTREGLWEGLLAIQCQFLRVFHSEVLNKIKGI